MDIELLLFSCQWIEIFNRIWYLVSVAGIFARERRAMKLWQTVRHFKTWKLFQIGENSVNRARILVPLNEISYVAQKHFH